MSSLHLNQSLRKGLAILHHIADHNGQMTMTELANALAMDRGTMRRFLATLQDLGYITSSPSDKTFSIALKSLELGYSAISGLEWREIAQQHLHSLFVEIGQTVSMCILVDADVQYMVRLEPPSSLASGISVGTRRPAYASSMGKMLLALQPDGEREQLVGRCQIKELTPFTVKSTAELLQQLHEVRKRGYAVSDREVSLFSRSVAIPVYCRNRVVAAAAVAVLVECFSVEELIEQLLPKLQTCVETVSRALEQVEYKI